MMEVSDVLLMWRQSGLHDEWRPGASAERVAEAERALGRSLPESLTTLYRATDGGDFFSGNLTSYPLLPSGDDPDELTVVTAGDLLRSWDWPVPEEMVVFAANGTDSTFGMWVPQDGPAARPVVVELGEVFEPACLAVVGTTLARFLAAWTAYYVPLNGGDMAAVQRLGVPADLLGRDGDEEAVGALLHWASPDLPDPRPDPYERGLTREQVGAFARR